MILDRKITFASTSWSDVCFQKLFPMNFKTKIKLDITGFFFLNCFPSPNFFQAIKVNFYVYLRTSNNIKQNKILAAVNEIAAALAPACF